MKGVVWIVEKNIRGAWVIYGADGIKQYYGYSKAGTPLIPKRRYRIRRHRRTMSDKVCKNCCEYDSPKGSTSGYCVQAKALTGCGVVQQGGSCCRFAAGQFSDRMRIRAERNGTEEWLEKCLSCTHCFKKKSDDETIFCRCRNGNCNYQEVKL